MPPSVTVFVDGFSSKLADDFAAATRGVVTPGVDARGRFAAVHFSNVVIKLRPRPAR